MGYTLEVTFLFVGIMLAWIYHRRKYPRDFPFGAGNLPAILGDFGRSAEMIYQSQRFYEFILEQTLKLKKWTWGYSILFAPRTYVVCHPTDLAHVLQHNFDNYIKGEQWRDKLGDLLGHGIFVTDGDLWHRQRHASSHLFKKRVMKSSVKVFNEHAEKVCTKLVQSIDSSEEAHVICEVQKLMSKFTMSAFCEIAFGFTSNGSQSATANENSLSEAQVEEFGDNFDSVSFLLQMRTVAPFYKWIPFHFVKPKLKVIDDLVYSIIDRKLAMSQETLEENEDIIARFLSIKNEDVENEVDFQCRETIRDVVLNFILAGRDTTAQLLTFSMYFLAKYPSIAAKVRSECVLNPSLDDLKDMKYMHAFLTEVLRLYPPVAVDYKEAVGEDVLPHSKVRIEPRSQIMWSAYVMGRHPELVKSPHEFMPERHLAEGEGGTNYPFQMGPRVCLGKNFAYAEAKTLLSLLVLQFNFELHGITKEKEPTLLPGLTIKAREGIHLKISKRQT